MALLLVFFGFGLLLQSLPPDPKANPKQDQSVPEEDAAVKPKDYTFNPLQATREVRAGDYYFHRGKFPAATARYIEATRWDPGNTEAWLKLGQAQEKQDESKLARAAYEKLIALDPNSKRAAEAKRRLEQLH